MRTFGSNICLRTFWLTLVRWLDILKYFLKLWVIKRLINKKKILWPLRSNSEVTPEVTHPLLENSTMQDFFQKKIFIFL